MKKKKSNHSSKTSRRKSAKSSKSANKSPKRTKLSKPKKTLKKLLAGIGKKAKQAFKNSTKTKSRVSSGNKNTTPAITTAVTPRIPSNGTKKLTSPTHVYRPLPSETSTPVASESVCREVACEGLATTARYCRMHYIKNWKKIKQKEIILKERKLNQYIEELVAKYPDKYIEAIRQDLTSDKDFAKVIYDLELDASAEDFEVETENVDHLIDNIRRDFEDEGEGGF